MNKGERDLFDVLEISTYENSYPAHDRCHRLRDHTREREEPRAFPGRQHPRFHLVSLLSRCARTVLCTPDVPAYPTALSGISSSTSPAGGIPDEERLGIYGVHDPGAGVTGLRVSTPDALVPNHRLKAGGAATHLYRDLDDGAL